jgi:hypothetical protein
MDDQESVATSSRRQAAPGQGRPAFERGDRRLLPGGAGDAEEANV